MKKLAFGEQNFGRTNEKTANLKLHIETKQIELIRIVAWR